MYIKFEEILKSHSGRMIGDASGFAREHSGGNSFSEANIANGIETTSASAYRKTNFDIAIEDIPHVVYGDLDVSTTYFQSIFFRWSDIKKYCYNKIFSGNDNLYACVLTPYIAGAGAGSDEETYQLIDPTVGYKRSAGSSLTTKNENVFAGTDGYEDWFLDGDNKYIEDVIQFRAFNFPLIDNSFPVGQIDMGYMVHDFMNTDGIYNEVNVVRQEIL
jgi:hypothetical protein